jgi:aryl-phospho-beta-D-glucosidase BglC (GH1 family)
MRSLHAMRLVAWWFILTIGGAGCHEPSAGPPPLSRLHAEGTDLVDAEGRVVRLRGVNLGGWIFHETWITGVDYTPHGRLRVLGQEAGLGEDVDAALIEVGPSGDASWLGTFEAALAARVGAGPAADLVAESERYPSLRDDSDLPLRQALSQRFGDAGRDRLLDAFEGAWIQEADIAWLASQGFNLVRVPMGYRALVTHPDDATPVSLAWNEPAFARVDQLLDWCEAHRVYAILDIQEAPGGQNDYSGPSRLYADPAMQALTVTLWEELSDRYRDRDGVAAYSLLAEPMGAPSAGARDDLYDRLVQAIRARGDDHLLVIHDGFRGMWTLPDPVRLGWQDVIYSTHFFEWGASSLQDYEDLIAYWDLMLVSSQQEQGVPYFAGSFSTMRDAGWAYEAAGRVAGYFESRGWAWSLWTYKCIDDPIDEELFGATSSWGLRGRLQGGYDRPDVWRDEESVLQEKLAAYATVRLDPNRALLDALRTAWD